MSSVDSIQILETSTVRVSRDVRQLAEALAVIFAEQTETKPDVLNSMSMAVNMFSQVPVHRHLHFLRFVRPERHPDYHMVNIRLHRKVSEKLSKLSTKYLTTRAMMLEQIIRTMISAICPVEMMPQHPDVRVRKAYTIMKQQTKYIPAARKRNKRQLCANPGDEVPRRKLPMKYTAYMDAFRKFLEQFGGLENMTDKIVRLPVHALPIPQPGDAPPRNDDTPEVAKDINPYRYHAVRILPRGRGYSVIVFGYGDEVHVAESYHPETNDPLVPPRLEIGGTYRLADIWPNIDWENIIINTGEEHVS